MRKKIIQITAILTLILSLSCSKSTEEGFNEANGDVVKKYIKQFQIFDNNRGNISYTINYGINNKVSSITNGNNTNVFLNYDESNDLKSIIKGSETFNIDELYQSPYDAFETGDVLEYDDKGNPVKIEVYEDGNGSNILIGDIIYDPNPNPFYYTLQAAGIIDILDRVDLTFGYSNPSIINAKLLLPYNNIKSMIFKNTSGITQYEVQINYNYGDDKYPISANVITLSQYETSTCTLIYNYK